MASIRSRDKAIICESLRLNHPLGVCLALAPTRAYWNRKTVKDFPAPHASKPPSGARTSVDRQVMKLSDIR